MQERNKLLHYKWDRILSLNCGRGNLDQLLSKVFFSNSKCIKAQEKIATGGCGVSSINDLFKMMLLIDSAVEEERIGDFPRFPRSLFLGVLKKI